MKNWFIVLMLLPCALQGQTNTPSPTGRVEFLPPEAAALMRYVDYPVSHLTGVPDIQIPLHEVQIGKLSLPLTLSFHTDNYSRPNQLPGSIGKGWSLSTELQITRQINGLDDLDENKLAPGYCYHDGIPADYREGDPVQRTELNAKELYFGRRDEEPDRFYYRLLGKSGAFYFQHQKDGGVKAVPVPYNGVRIEYGKDKRFTIWDTDGTKYVFSATAVDTEQKPGTNETVDIAWKCEQIFSPQGQSEINFTYNTPRSRPVTGYNDRIEVNDRIRGIFSIPDMTTNTKNTLQTWEGKGIKAISDYAYWRIAGIKGKEFAATMGTWLIYRKGIMEQAPALDGVNRNYVTADETPAVSSKQISYRYLKQIDFRGGRMVFIYPTPETLGSIAILNNGGDTVKTIAFTQRDMSAAAGDPQMDYWRTLTSVRSGDRLYTFDYPFFVGGGPYYTTDYWGYKLLRAPVGRESNVVRHRVRVSRGEGVYSFVRFTDNDPTLPADTAVTVGHVDPAGVFAYNEIPVTFLKIGYPTGGSVEFVMGQHRYRSQYGDRQPQGAGGYRIEQILYRDGDTKIVRKKTYRYGPGEDGCGIVKNEPYFDEDPVGETRRTAVTEQRADHYWEHERPDGIIDEPEAFMFSQRKRVYSMSGTQSLSFESGSTVHYNEVAEYEMDMGQKSGKTVYKYDFPFMPYIHTTPQNPYPLEPEQWAMGALDSVVRYEYRDGRYEWVRRERYVYDKYVDSALIYRCRVWSPLIVEFHTNVTSHDFKQWTFDKIKNELKYNVSGLHTGCLRLASREVQTRDVQNRVLTDRTAYHYDCPNRYTASRTERTLSDGTTLVDQTLYPEDYVLSGNGLYSALVGKNIVSVPVEHIRRRDGHVVSGEWYGYDASGNLTSQSRLEKDDTAESRFRLSNKSLPGHFLPEEGRVAASPDPGYKEVLSIPRYDAYGNPLEVCSRTAPYTVCYLWGYDGLYPIAEIVGARYDLLLSTLGDGLIRQIASAALLPPQLASRLNSLRYDAALGSAHISTRTYRPLVGMLSNTDPRGVATQYEYDPYNRLRSVWYDENGQKKTLKYYEYHYNKQ